MRFVSLSKLLVTAAVGGTLLVCGIAVAQNQPRDLNPQHDPDIQRGIEQQQEYIQREREAEKQRSEDGQPHTERQYQEQQHEQEWTVEKSHQTKGD